MGNLASSTALPGGYASVQYTEEANVCTYSTQSFTNDRCREAIGNSSIKSFGDTIINRMRGRYTSDSYAVPLQSGSLNLNSNYRLSNSVRYVKANGNASIESAYCMGVDATNNNTLVIDVAGTLTIRGNIMYGSGSGSGCTEQQYRNIAEMPQILIFADDINIASNVTRIDAWLISGQKGRGSGNINTCSDMSGSQIGNGYTIPKSMALYIPCSNQLRVSGPVFAKKLILNRNAGAGTGNASIRPAEVFDLRPDTYLWAYNQASRFSQAVTTYQRELAPRY